MTERNRQVQKNTTISTGQGYAPNYLEQRRAMKNGTAPVIDKKKDKKETKAFFDAALLEMPDNCENCGKYLGATVNMHSRAATCHIVKKSKKDGVPAVAKHPNNRFFGCLQCHTDYDTKSESEVAKMPVIDICVERLKTFYHLIPADQVKRVPMFLREKLISK